MTGEDGDDRGFKVQDKRRFTETGEVRESDGGRDDEERERERDRSAPADEPARPDAPGGDGAAVGGGDSSQAEGAAEADPEGALPGELSFSSFVYGLASQALMFLGLAPDPHAGVIHKDLAQARAMIDIIVMLRDKTAGNLSEDEDRLMEEMLYELQMQYVRDVRGDNPTEGNN